MKNLTITLALLTTLTCYSKRSNNTVIVKSKNGVSLKAAPGNSEKTITNISEGTKFRKIQNSEIQIENSEEWIEVTNENYNGYLLSSQVISLKAIPQTKIIPETHYKTTCAKNYYSITKLPTFNNITKITLKKSTNHNSNITISERLNINKDQIVTFDLDQIYSKNIPEKLRFIPEIKNFLAITEITEAREYERKVNILYLNLNSNIYSINLKHLIIENECVSYDAYKFYEEDLPFVDYSLIVSESPSGLDIKYQKFKCAYKESRDFLSTEILESTLTKVSIDESNLILTEYCFEGNFPDINRKKTEKSKSIFDNSYKDYFL
ncbi:hypothetical protein [Leptospira bandrabouensis]|uniref:SH3 domain-containing protein n=1 Tax=Leptospira bandrabouensis TaxID=2484903 RepID=A0A6H3NK99_9LEPT|nr:hypothetical protein [Leptospira bandrabouensis]TGN06286.1 hypothetical protein EHR07_17390 [Leptospira bandrabouensis]TGN11775.1 hypothetical protein EHR08_16930 [Leptospira bandrabouensis]